MSKNENLGNAKQSKYDEYYTRYEDIEKEIEVYYAYDRNVFRNKVILLPCDDPEWSNFTKYFVTNFTRFGIKKLISTSYSDKMFGEYFVMTKTCVYHRCLSCNGDFRSEEVTNLRDEADIIITNPPFSLFREFLDWIMKANKQFIILGTVNMLTYKNVFQYFKDNKMWFGHMSLNRDMYFNIPYSRRLWLLNHKKEGYAYKCINGNVFGRLASSCWFTNLDHGKRNNMLDLSGNYYVSENYPKYDNYDAIEVSRVNDIPSDYYGTMGVPITFLAKYNPEQFEIIGNSAKLAKPVVVDGHKKSGRFYVNGKRMYDRVVIKRK